MNNCSICNNELKFIFSTKDYLVSGETFDILECNSCFLRITNPFPDKQNIGNYYLSDDYISHNNEGTGFLDNIYSFVRSYQLKKKKKLIEKYYYKDTKKILDIGCGAGDFLEIMKKGDWDIYGVDTSKKIREIVKNKLKIEIMDPDSWIKSDIKFDVITCWHSLEHVHEPWVYLKKIKESLNPGGILIIALPNYHSTDAKRYKEYWAAYDTPRHLYHFTKQSIINIIHPHGFNIQSIYRMNFDPFYVSILSAAHMGKSIIHGLINGFNSWALSIIYKNKCSSLIFIIK